MSANQFNAFSQLIGFAPLAPNNGLNTLTLNATTPWAAWSFVPDQGKTINKLRFYLRTVAGTGGTISVEIWSDSSGSPGSALASGTSSTFTGSIAAATYVEFTGLAAVLTAGTRYWIVIKNTAGAPNTNNVNVWADGSNMGHTPIVGNIGNGPQCFRSYNGATWNASTSASLLPLRIGYSDSTYEGQPQSNNGIGLGASFTGFRAQGTKECGFQFTTPANITLKIAGITFYVTSNGTPTGNPRYRLYTGASPSLLATTNTYSKALIGASTGWLSLWLPSVQSIAGGTVLSVMMGEDSNSDSAGTYYTPYGLICDTDSNSLPLMPLDGLMQGVSFDGVSTWAAQTGDLPAAALILDSNGEFTASGGGMILSRLQTGM